MIRGASAMRRAQWQKRMERFVGSQMTVGEFCRREDVSVAAFYQWRRKLAETPTNPENGSKQFAQPTFVPVQLTSGANLQFDFPNGVRLTLPAQDHELVKLSIMAVAVARTTGEA